MAKISIIGSGNVGRRIGEDFGKNVIFYDVLPEVVEGLNNSGHEATLDIGYAVRETDISFVAVPTPLLNGTYDNSFLESAGRNIGNALAGKDEYHTVVLKSTVTPGTTEEIFIPAVEEYGKKDGSDFGVVYNPEFLTVIENTWTDDDRFCITPEKEGRIVLGEGKNKKAGDVIEELYRKIHTDVPVLRTDYKTAEMTKLAANNRLALAISYSNEVFLFAEELKKHGIGIDADFVMRALSMDPRIGHYGSVFGKAYGGPCFLKDTVALKSWLEEITGTEPKIISGSIEVNNEMKEKYGVRE